MINTNPDYFIEIEPLFKQVRQAMDDVSRFCNLSRSIEFQKEKRDDLIRLINDVRQFKSNAIRVSNEHLANMSLALEGCLTSMLNELEMWIAFKNDDPNTAWTQLINAQSCMIAALRAHDITSDYEDYCQRLHVLEHCLFPPMMFFSAGLVVKRSECSICGSEYGDCDHIKGKVYMGQYCSRIIKECSPTEISIVDEPASKHCRVISISENGIMRDFLTWRKIQETDELPPP